MKPSLAIVVPTFQAFSYARLAVASALRHTRLAAAHVLVVDDASPGGDKELAALAAAANRLAAECGQPAVAVHRFPENGGLTRSWNQGLRWARDRGLNYACVTNSDVRFTPGWDVPLLQALERYDLVGPVTNAPGTEAMQFVGRYTAKYQRSDAEDLTTAAAVDLRKRYADVVLPGTINGFCMTAKTAVWWAGAYDRRDVFKPLNTHNSQGRPNPTPTMTLNEYELQRRWHAQGRRTGFCPASYVVHYRAVSRGDVHKKGDWLRLAPEGRAS